MQDELLDLSSTLIIHKQLVKDIEKRFQNWRGFFNYILQLQSLLRRQLFNIE